MSTSISTTGFVSYLSTLYRRCLFDIDLPLSTFIYLFAPVYPPGTVRHVGGADGTAREGDTTRCLSSPAVADAETTQRFAPPGGVVLDHSDVDRSVHCYQSPSCCCRLLVLSGRTTLMLLTVVAVFLIVEFPLAILFVILIVQNTVASSAMELTKTHLMHFSDKTCYSTNTGHSSWKIQNSRITLHRPGHVETDCDRATVTRRNTRHPADCLSVIRNKANVG